MDYLSSVRTAVIVCAGLIVLTAEAIRRNKTP